MTLITRYRTLAVKRRLHVIIIGGGVCGFACLSRSHLSYIQFELCDDSQHDLTTLALVYGANATAALNLRRPGNNRTLPLP
jgi:hypothetical protein